MILDKYTNSSLIQHITSEGTTFTQMGGDSNKQFPPYYKSIGEYTMLHMLTQRLPSILLHKNNYQY